MAEVLTKTRKPRAPRVVALNPPVLAVLNYDKREQACPECRQPGLTYCCADMRRREDGGGEVIRRCKGCAEAYAAECGLTVAVKSTWPNLQKVWQQNKRLEATPAMLKGLEAIKAQNKRVAGVSGQSVGVTE